MSISPASRSLTGPELHTFALMFEIPENLEKYIPRLFSEEELSAALARPDRIFSVQDWTAEWLSREYRKGFVNKTDDPELFRLNNLYGMLDVFVVSRKEEYDSLFSMEEKREMDDWYFDAYFAGLTPDEKGRLTEDRVMTLSETLDVIARDPRQIYLNYCDCRSLTGECGMPTRTCLTWKNAPNSFADRGLSKPLTKEEAMDVVREADRRGLMHTTMSGGICNCCSDCCYLFRSQRRAGTYGLWPESKWIAAYDADKCISCGICAKRCWLGVFEKKDKSIHFDNTQCAGCGLCVNSCPRGALKLVPREVLQS